MSGFRVMSTYETRQRYGFDPSADLDGPPVFEYVGEYDTKAVEALAMKRFNWRERSRGPLPENYPTEAIMEMYRKRAMYDTLEQGRVPHD